MTLRLNRRHFMAGTASLIAMHPFSANAQAGQAHLRLMETTDLHVHVFPYDYYADKPVDTVGLARTAAIIEDVRAERSGGLWRFDVTVSHPDTGWDHYADGWEVLDRDGNSLGLRVLMHPHVNEQPFTRSLTRIDIPKDITTVYVRARCNVDGWGDDLFEVALR